MTGLTPVQIDAMQFIESYLDLHGFVPTYQEISKHLGHQSKSSAYRIVERLVERGYLRRTNGGARAMVIVRRLGAALEGSSRIEALESLCSTIANLSPAGRDPEDDAETLNRLIAVARSIFPRVAA